MSACETHSHAPLLGLRLPPSSRTPLQVVPKRSQARRNINMSAAGFVPLRVGVVLSGSSTLRSLSDIAQFICLGVLRLRGAHLFPPSAWLLGKFQCSSLETRPQCPTASPSRKQTCFC